MWQGWISLVLGAWLLLSAFIPSLQTTGNLVLVGILSMVFGFWTYRDWRGDTIGVLGLWAFLSGVWFNFVSPLNFIVVGLIIAVSGLWEGLTHTQEATPHAR